MIDLETLWDFSDLPASEARFRAAIDGASGVDAGILQTQLARALGLQDRFDEAHAVLGAIGDSGPEVATRVELERGRLLRSAGDGDGSAPRFDRAAELAEAAGLDALLVDAIHMQAIVADGSRQVELNERALRVARASSDPRARNWDAPLLNNLGMSYADAGDFTRALELFEEALEARRRIGDASRTRVATWMVAWALRNLGRREEALAMQLALKQEFDEAGETDEYVDEEIALLMGSSGSDSQG